jgi:hypothetical protein
VPFAGGSPLEPAFDFREGRLITDPEGLLIADIVGGFRELQPDAIRRILAYVNDRYGSVFGDDE